MSHDMENPKIAQSPHLGVIKCMYSVYQVLLCFWHAPGDKAMFGSHICTAGWLPGNETTSLIPFCCLYFVIFTFTKNASIGH